MNKIILTALIACGTIFGIQAGHFGPRPAPPKHHQKHHYKKPAVKPAKQHRKPAVKPAKQHRKPAVKPAKRPGNHKR